MWSFLLVWFFFFLCNLWVCALPAPQGTSPSAGAAPPGTCSAERPSGQCHRCHGRENRCLFQVKTLVFWKMDVCGFCLFFPLLLGNLAGSVLCALGFVCTGPQPRCLWQGSVSFQASPAARGRFAHPSHPQIVPDTHRHRPHVPACAAALEPLLHAVKLTSHLPAVCAASCCPWAPVAKLRFLCWKEKNATKDRRLSSILLGRSAAACCLLEQLKILRRNLAFLVTSFRRCVSPARRDAQPLVSVSLVPRSQECPQPASAPPRACTGSCPMLRPHLCCSFRNPGAAVASGRPPR